MTQNITANSGHPRTYYMVVIDGAGKIEYINTNLAKTLHMEDYVGGSSNFFEYLQVAEVANLKSTLHNISIDKKQSLVETSLKNGRSHWIKWEINNLQNGVDTKGKYLCVGHEVIKKEESKNYFDISDEHYQAIAEDLSVGVVFSDAAGKVIAANKYAADIFKIEVQEIHREGAFYDVIESVEINNKVISLENYPHFKAVESGQTQSETVKITCYSGEKLWLICNCKPLINKEGTVHAVVTTMQDITTQKNLEEELIIEKLNQQRAIAEAIITAQEQERHNLGHELHDNVNQLLTTTKLYLEMLHPSTGNEFMVVSKAKELILKALTEIRNISKMSVMPKFYEKGLVDSINEVLEDINIIGKYYISFVHDDEAGIKISEGKKTALFRILQEQLKNIIKHSNAKTIKVKLSFDSKCITLSVKDDGVGFDTTSKSRGIGLSNIYDRTNLYKGTIMLNSAPGEGCQMLVTIPVDEKL
ncbi:MAG: PAS domain S-box protein [Gemmatimonadaceae bacterium]|nr:PAS domain S-box protein [Chitinophagaceae bacterium]